MPICQGTKIKDQKKIKNKKKLVCRLQMEEKSNCQRFHYCTANTDKIESIWKPEKKKTTQQKGVSNESIQFSSRQQAFLAVQSMNNSKSEEILSSKWNTTASRDW